MPDTVNSAITGTKRVKDWPPLSQGADNNVHPAFRHDTRGRHSGPIPPPGMAQIEGLRGVTSLEDPVERQVDEIEMIGEEMAAGFPPPGHSEITAGMRDLHCSRTIHQLVTDRNRAVGLYLAVASLLWTASSALLNVKPTDQYNYEHLMVPLRVMHAGACRPRSAPWPCWRSLSASC